MTAGTLFSNLNWDKAGLPPAFQGTVNVSSGGVAPTHVEFTLTASWTGVGNCICVISGSNDGVNYQSLDTMTINANGGGTLTQGHRGQFSYYEASLQNLTGAGAVTTLTIAY